MQVNCKKKLVTLNFRSWIHVSFQNCPTLEERSWWMFVWDVIVPKLFIKTVCLKRWNGQGLQVVNWKMFIRHQVFGGKLTGNVSHLNYSQYRHLPNEVFWLRPERVRERDNKPALAAPRKLTQEQVKVLFQRAGSLYAELPHDAI